MNDKARKDEENEIQEKVTSEANVTYSDHKRTIRRINPLGMRVLVRIRNLEDTTEGGLYLPDSAKDKMSDSVLAEVLEVASAIDQDTDEEANISGIPDGALILIKKEVGTKVPWDDALRIVDTKDVLGIVNEVDLV